MSQQDSRCSYPLQSESHAIIKLYKFILLLLLLLLLLLFSFLFHSHFAPTVATDEFRVVERIKRKCKSLPKLTKACVSILCKLSIF